MTLEVSVQDAPNMQSAGEETWVVYYEYFNLLHSDMQVAAVAQSTRVAA